MFSASSQAIGQNSPTGAIEFSVRSFWTNYSVPATVTARSEQTGQVTTVATDETGRLRLDLPPGNYVFSIRAQGYESSDDAHFRIEARQVFPLTIVIRPLSEPEELKVEPTLFRPGFTLVVGWIVDAVTGKPLQNVRVRIEGARTEEQTNERGYYALSVPSPAAKIVAGGEIPGTGTLIAQLPGYKTSIEKNILLPDGMDAGMNEELEPWSTITAINWTSLPIPLRELNHKRWWNLTRQRQRHQHR